MGEKHKKTKKGYVWRKGHIRTLKSGKKIRIAGQWVKSIRTSHYTWAKKQKDKRKTSVKTARKIYKTPRCGPGEIIRDGYVRKSYIRTLSDGRKIRIPKTIVAPICIKDTGLPGKGPRKIKGKIQKIGPVQKGLLRKYGYSMTKTAEMRRIALKKAIKTYGKNSVIRKVNAIVVWNKYKNPTLSNKAKNDVKWIQKNYSR